MPEGYTLTDSSKDLSYGVPEGYTLTDSSKDLSYGVPEGYIKPDAFRSAVDCSIWIL